MRAARIDLVLQAGATWQEPFTWETAPGTPKSLTGYTARMQVRQTHDAATPLLDLTTENGGLTITAASGTVTTFVTAAATAALADFGIGVYDLELVETATGKVTRLVEGAVTYSPEVTR